MDRLESTILPLAHQGQFIYSEGLRQGRQKIGEDGCQPVPFNRVKLAGKCHVKTERFHDIGIAPALQVSNFHRRKVDSTPARQFCRVGQGTKRVQSFDAGRRQRIQCRCRVNGRKGQECAQRLQRQAGQFDWTLAVAEFFCRLDQRVRARAGFQPKRWLDRGVEAVFPRGIGQRGKVRVLLQGSRRIEVPAQPASAEPRQFAAHGWQIVDCKPSEV